MTDPRQNMSESLQETGRMLDAARAKCAEHEHDEDLRDIVKRIESAVIELVGELKAEVQALRAENRMLRDGSDGQAE